MPDRYFVAEPIAGDSARLADEEAHHLAHVMRAKPGLEVVLFDGSGAEWQARVTRVGRSEVELELLSRHEIDREPSCELTLGVALPKGDRQRWLVEKAVELGVRRIVPLMTTRGVAQPVDKSLARLRRAVVEASKQCGRNRLMEIAPPATCGDYLAAEQARGLCRALADPSGTQSLATFLAAQPNTPLASMSFAVGPEGGFTEQELDAARSCGWSVVSLGARILRVETAALYLAAASELVNGRHHLGQAT
ncbi:MAG TPA: 16S rRNA (uracil(1498)-N(3))-methyltransferase [Pirellulales bacterium]|nr:16S rRNA (uracil(1498)-N(3))-methyltransferase [Pirellulales bacterium]